jgi:hypothetical protein
MTAEAMRKLAIGGRQAAVAAWTVESLLLAKDRDVALSRPNQNPAAVKNEATWLYQGSKSSPNLGL